MIDEAKLKEIADWFEVPNDTVRTRDEFRELLRLARLGLWARTFAVEPMRWAKEMLLARDEMNAKVHCAPVRLSPITERINAALEALPKEE